MIRITDALLGEHGVFYALMQATHDAAKAGRTADVRANVGYLAAALASHATIENELFFPALQPHIGPAGPIMVMRMEHEEIERLLVEITEGAEADTVNLSLDLLELLAGHFAKEENILFPLASNAMSEAAQYEVGAVWAERRGVTLADHPACG